MSRHLTPREMLAYLDEELTQAECPHIVAHLRACDSCCAEIERLRDDLALTKQAMSERCSVPLPSATKPWEPLDKLLEREREGPRKAASDPSTSDQIGNQEPKSESE